MPTTLHRVVTVAGMMLAAVLSLSACSASHPSDTAASPARTHASASTSTPTPKPSAKGTVNGKWCPTRQSNDSRCVTVKLPEVTYDDGSSFTIVDKLTHRQSRGVVSYSFQGAPFGTFYPAGVGIDLPDRYSGDDRSNEDRIWNSQVGVLLLRKTTEKSDDLAAELDGEWRSKDGSETFSMADVREDNPDAFVSSTMDSDDVPGATDITICLAADSGKGECTTSASMFLRYFPAGTRWDCAKAGREGKLPYGFDSCDPDYTDEHDPSKPRLIRLPSHQHNKEYVDSVPMYELS